MPSRGLQEGKRSIVVVYDRTRGDIVHVHEVVTERGGRHPSMRAVEKEALALAAGGSVGRTLGRKQMKTISVKASRLEHDPNVLLHVDVKRRRLERVQIRR